MSASTTDRSAHIRAALKAKGWSSRDVSVKSEYYSMGSSIRVVIKNPTVPSAVVESIANEHESIDRDQWGEILSGGNRFVFVNYSAEALAHAADPYRLAVQQAIDALPDNDRSLQTIDGTPYMVGRTDGGRFSLWSDAGHQAETWDVSTLAELLAVRMINAEAR